MVNPFWMGNRDCTSPLFVGYKPVPVLPVGPMAQVQSQGVQTPEPRIRRAQGLEDGPRRVEPWDGQISGQGHAHRAHLRGNLGERLVAFSGIKKGELT